MSVYNEGQSSHFQRQLRYTSWLYVQLAFVQGYGSHLSTLLVQYQANPCLFITPQRNKFFSWLVAPKFANILFPWHNVDEVTKIGIKRLRGLKAEDLEQQPFLLCWDGKPVALIVPTGNLGEEEIATPKVIVEKPSQKAPGEDTKSLAAVLLLAST